MCIRDSLIEARSRLQLGGQQALCHLGVYPVAQRLQLQGQRHHLHAGRALVLGKGAAQGGDAVRAGSHDALHPRRGHVRAQLVLERRAHGLAVRLEAQDLPAAQKRDTLDALRLR